MGFTDGLNLGAIGNIVALVGVAGLDKFEQDLNKMGKAVDGQAQFMNKSMLAAAAAGALVFTSSIAAATEFQSTFAGVVKTVDGISDEFGVLNAAGEELAAQFRELALEVPISVNELNKIGELGGQLGIPKEELLDFTRVIADLGNTTNLSIDAGATQLARFINITGAVAPAGASISEQASRIGSAIVELGNNMATTEAEIAQFGLRIAGAGAQVGLSQAEIMGFGAALSSIGVNAEAGGTAFSKLMIDISASVEEGGAQVEKFAKITNMTVPEFSRLFREDAAGAMTTFFQGLDETKKSAGTLFPTLEDLGYTEVRLRDTILKASSAAGLFTDAMNFSTNAFRENNAMAEEAQKRYGTFKSQLTLVGNQFNDLYIDIGNKFLPVLSDTLSVINSNNTAFQVIGKSVGTMALVLGAAAIGWKLYSAGAALARAANVAMVGSLGPIALVITGVVVAVTAMNAAFDAAAKARKAEITSLATQANAVSGMEARYRELASKAKLTADEERELNRITGELDSAYRGAGISVMAMSDNFGNLTAKIREANFEKLTGQLADVDAQMQKIIDRQIGTADDGFFAQLRTAFIQMTGNSEAMGKSWDRLQGQAEDLKNGLKKLTDGQRVLRDAGYETNESIQEEITKLEGMRASAAKGTVQFKALTEDINALKEKLRSAAGDTAPTDWAKVISDAGIKTTAVIRDEIAALTEMYPHLTGDKAALKQLKTQMEELYAAIGENPPWSLASEGAKAFFKIADDATGVTGKLRVDYNELGEVMEKYTTKQDAMAAAGVKSSEANNDLILKLEHLRKTYPLTAYEAGQVEDMLAQLRGETVAGKDEWAQYAIYVQQISDKFGGLFGSIGSTVAEGMNLFATFRSGAFDPLTLGVNAATFGFNALKSVWGALHSETPIIKRSLEEVEASLGSVQTRIEKTNEVISNMGISSGYISHLQETIDQYKQEMTATTQGWYDLLAESVGHFESILEDLTYTFRLDDALAGFTDNLDVLLEKAKYYTDYFGDIDMSGFAQLLKREIDASKEMLDQLDPLSKAYSDLAGKLQDAYGWYRDLAGPTNALNDLYPDLAENIARVYEATQMSTRFAGDEELMLERLKTSRVLNSTSIAEQIGLYEQLLPLLEEGSEEYQAVVDVLAILRQETEANTEAAYDFVDSMEAVASAIREQYDDFTGELKAASRAIDELLFFQVDLDTTGADEEIEAIMADWMVYLQTLNPDSPAFAQGLAALQELWQKYSAAKSELSGLNDEGDRFNDAVLKPLQDTAKAANDMADSLGDARAKITVDVETDDDIAKELSDEAGKGGKVKLPVELDPSFPDMPQIPEFDLPAELGGVDTSMEEILRRKYDGVVSQLENARGYLDALLAGESDKLEEIDARYESQVSSREQAVIDLEGRIQTLTEQRTAIHAQYRDQLIVLGDQSRDIKTAVDALMADDEPWTIRRIEEAVADLSGVTRSFMFDWNEMLDTMMGGTSSEFDAITKTAEKAKAALDKALYFEEDIGGTEVESQINGMIFSMLAFMDTLSPTSQAWRDARETIDGLIESFGDVGGALNESDAEQSAADWAEQVRQGLEGQMDQLVEDDTLATLPINVEISEAEAQLAIINAELTQLNLDWSNETLAVSIDIEQAMANVDSLETRLGILDASLVKYTDRWDDPIEFVGDITGAKDSLDELDRDLQEVFDDWNGRVISIDVAIGDPAASGAALATIDQENLARKADDIVAGDREINIYEATPQTYYELSDRFIEPRINERSRRYSVGRSPYASGA